MQLYLLYVSFERWIEFYVFTVPNDECISTLSRICCMLLMIYHCCVVHTSHMRKRRKYVRRDEYCVFILYRARITQASARSRWGKEGNFDRSTWFGSGLREGIPARQNSATALHSWAEQAPRHLHKPQLLQSSLHCIRVRILFKCDYLGTTTTRSCPARNFQITMCVWVQAISSLPDALRKKGQRGIGHRGTTWYAQ